jgi:hypothetical protein
MFTDTITQLPTIDTSDMSICSDFACVCRPASSPCRRRPDTGRPCVLLKKHKDNSICSNCGLIPGKGRRVWSDAEIIAAIKAGLLEPRIEIARITPQSHNPHPCAFPDCPEIIKKGKMCREHGAIVANRRQAWAQKYPGPPDPAWVFRPIIKRK